jgi:hypothetical protein
MHTNFEPGAYTKIEFWDASFKSGSSYPCLQIRRLGRGYAPVDYPTGYVVPPPDDGPDDLDLS